MFSLPKGCNTLRTFCHDLKFGQFTLVAKRQSQSADLKKYIYFMKNYIKTIVLLHYCFILLPLYLCINKYALFYCPLLLHLIGYTN